MAVDPIKVPNDLKKLVEVTNPTLLKKLRTAVAPPGKKGSWLKFLNDAQLLEVFYRLQQGQPAHGLVLMAQKEWRIKPNSQTNSLARSLRKFRKDVVGEIMDADLNTEAKKEEAKALTKRGRKVSEQIDALELQAQALTLWWERIQLIYTKEKKDNSFFKFADASLKGFTEACEKFVTQQMKLGLLESQPRRVQLDVSHNFQGLMAHTIREDKPKVLAAANRFMELAQENALTFEIGEDGNYHFLNDEDIDATRRDSCSEGDQDCESDSD